MPREDRQCGYFRRRSTPGVVCTLTGAEIAVQTQPFIEIGPEPFAKIKDYPMAASKVRYQGEPVAAVVAESPAIADDAAELVQVEYESLDPVVDAEEALQDKSLLHEEAGTNRVWNGVFEYGDVEKAFKDAAYIVNIDRLHFHRFSSTPLETTSSSPRGILKMNASILLQQFVPLIRDSVSRGASECSHRSYSCETLISVAALASRSPATRRWQSVRGSKKAGGYP